MFKKSTLFCLSIVFAIAGFGQSLSPTVFASAGGTNTVKEVTLDWTLGEIAVETYSSSQQLFTQGFHQPLVIIQRPASIVSSLLSGYKVSIFPNPVSSVINVQIASPVDGKINITLREMNGRAVYSQPAMSGNNTVKIDISSYTTGVYLLTLINSSGSVIGSYKIIKAK